MVELTHRNTRRYGGYLVHVGIVILFVGFTGKAFDKDKTVEISRGQTVGVGNYSLTATNMETGQNENYRWSILTLDVAKNGVPIGQVKPEQRMYTVSRQQTSEVAIRRRLDEDLYVNFAGTNGEKLIIQTYVFPLVSWIWIGYWVVLFGTIICMVPSKSRLMFPRMEVVGIASKDAKVEN